MADKTNATRQDQEKDALVKKRLLLAKMMYEHGREHSEKPDPLSKMLAMHHFHNAVEITLKCIFNERGVKTNINLRRLGFEPLWDAIDKHLKEEGLELPARGYMMVLNDQRNSVQHSASEPGTRVVIECNVNTKNFLVEAFLEFFVEDYAKLNARSLIHNEKVRKALDKAAQYLEEDDLRKSCAASKIVFLAAEFVISPLNKLGIRDLPYFSPNRIKSDLAQKCQEDGIGAVPTPVNCLADIIARRLFHFHRGIRWIESIANQV